MSRRMTKDGVKDAAEECDTPEPKLGGLAAGWLPERGLSDHLVPRRVRTVHDGSDALVKPISTRQEAEKAIWAFEEITWPQTQADCEKRNIRIYL